MKEKTQTNKPDDGDSSSLTDQKSILEIEKLRNEIKLQRRPLANPANWAPFATILAASFALLWALCTNWFQYQARLLKDQEDSLSIKREFIKKEKDTLDHRLYLVKAGYKNTASKLSAQNSAVLKVYSKAKDIETKGKIIDTYQSYLASNAKYASHDSLVHKGIKKMDNIAHQIKISCAFTGGIGHAMLNITSQDYQSNLEVNVNSINNLSLLSGLYLITVTGNNPSGGDFNIEISSETGQLLKSERYSGGAIYGAISFEVK